MRGDPKVFLILFSVFAALGVYLIIYSHKKSNTIKSFSLKKGMHYEPKDTVGLEKKLNEKLGIEDGVRLRSFFGIKDLVTDGQITLFRCIELLSLNPYRRSTVTHHERVAVTFEVPEPIDLFFRVDSRVQYSSIYPKEINLEENSYFRSLKPILQSNQPKYTLTLTFRNGYALIYLHPFVIGGENEEDYEYLVQLGRRIKRLFSGQ